MAGRAAVTEARQDGQAVRVLTSPDGTLEAAFAPGAGMVGCSLRHRGEQLLGLRGGLAAYVEKGSTMGIPLLAPWANRLSDMSYRAAGATVVLDPRTTPIRLDPGGLAIHGLLGAAPYWDVVEAGVADGAARLVASLDFGAHPELLSGFPFPHRLIEEIELRDGELSIATTLRATGAAEVPVSFGYHPYLRLPGVAREEWEVTLPLLRRVVLDERGIPAGESESVSYPPAPLGNRTFDDLFDELDDPPEFVLAGAGRRIALRLRGGYEFAQVYAPADQELICFEPMTAPTNALVSGEGLSTVRPGDSYFARFTIAVS